MWQRLKPNRFFDGRHWEEAQRRRIAEGGHTAPAGLNGAVTLVFPAAGIVGELALTGGRVGSHLRDRHDHTELATFRRKNIRSKSLI
jgi:hypothetical protein